VEKQSLVVGARAMGMTSCRYMVDVLSLVAVLVLELWGFSSSGWMVVDDGSFSSPGKGRII
jgi:hypothetical protein